mmetsp:Transcript_7159/g.20861  ORF Transcript_7159/g.20861 Transcript_7159/m.20861 type:complete len:208 (-) Transcript_7159:2377-3000(-)
MVPRQGVKDDASEREDVHGLGVPNAARAAFRRIVGIATLAGAAVHAPRLLFWDGLQRPGPILQIRERRLPLELLLLLQEHLWRLPARRSHPRPIKGALLRLKLLAQAHVGHLCLVCAREQHVLWFEVPVHDSHVVQSPYGLPDVRDHFEQHRRNDDADHIKVLAHDASVPGNVLSARHPQRHDPGDHFLELLRVDKLVKSPLAPFKS